MTNTTLDEYAPNHAPVSRPLDRSDASGRDVDHRPTPGAFGAQDRGFVLENAAVDEPAQTPKWMPGAVHHPESVVTKPAAERDEARETSTEASNEPASVASTGAEAPAPAGFARRLLSGIDERLRSNFVVRVVVGRFVDVQRSSADTLEAWLEQGTEPRSR